MTDIQQELRSMAARLKADIRTIDAAPREALRRVGKRRAMFVLSGLMIFVSLASVGVLALPIEQPDTPADKDQPMCDQQDSGKGSLQYTGPPVLVAEGQIDGTDWHLCARTGEFDGGYDSVEALCWEALFFQRRSGGFECIGTVDRSLDSDYFFARDAWPEPGEADHRAFFGAVPADTTKVVYVSYEEGHRSKNRAELFDAPEELGVPFKFYVGFAPPYPDKAVVEVFGEDGSMIRSDRSMTPPVLVVSKSGLGEGTVKAFPVKEMYRDNPIREAPEYVDCGADCGEGWVTNRVRLVAIPSRGSTFEEWSGPEQAFIQGCQREPVCVINTKPDAEIVARFEPSADELTPTGTRTETAAAFAVRAVAHASLLDPTGQLLDYQGIENLPVGWLVTFDRYDCSAGSGQRCDPSGPAFEVRVIEENGILRVESDSDSALSGYTEEARSEPSRLTYPTVTSEPVPEGSDLEAGEGSGTLIQGVKLWEGPLPAPGVVAECTLRAFDELGEEIYKDQLSNTRATGSEAGRSGGLFLTVIPVDYDDVFEATIECDSNLRAGHGKWVPVGEPQFEVRKLKDSEKLSVLVTSELLWVAEERPNRWKACSAVLYNAQGETLGHGSGSVRGDHSQERPLDGSFITVILVDERPARAETKC